MAAASYLYAQALLALLNKEIDWNSDTIKAMLLTSSYTPDVDAHNYKDDLTNEVTGTGYTAAGATVTSPTMTYTAAASATAWQASHAYAVNDTVRKVSNNGHVYRCIVAGTSSSSEPTWPTGPGATVTDGSVTWAEAGKGFIMIDCDDPTWSASTITARYCVLYDSSPSTDATRPLIALLDLGQDFSSSSATFTVTINSNGVHRIFVN